MPSTPLLRHLPRAIARGTASPSAASTLAPSQSSPCRSISSPIRMPRPRQFTTTTSLQTKTLDAQKIPAALVPPYPYGPRTVYKQSNNGLYGFARIRFGNNVAPRYKNKTPRTWRPNVHKKKLWSDGLQAWVKTRLTTGVLRTIKKEGGLDAYLLKNKPMRVKELGPGGWKLRWLVMQTESVRKTMDEERKALGIVGAGVVDEQADKNARDLVRVAVDYATPGPLSRPTRDILDAGLLRAMAEQDEFDIGEEADEAHRGADIRVEEAAGNGESKPEEAVKTQ